MVWMIYIMPDQNPIKKISKAAKMQKLNFGFRIKIKKLLKNFKFNITKIIVSISLVFIDIFLLKCLLMQKTNLKTF
jgi:hypothetical protein